MPGAVFLGPVAHSTFKVRVSVGVSKRGDFMDL